MADMWPLAVTAVGSIAWLISILRSCLDLGDCSSSPTRHSGYTSGSCPLLEFLLHSFRDIQSSLASASDGNRPGQARCMALRRRCDFRWEVTNCPTLRVSSSIGDTTVPRQTRSRTSTAAPPADSHVLK